MLMLGFCAVGLVAPPLRRQGGQAGKDAGSVRTYKGTLEFPDMTNADVDNGRFESDVRRVF